MAANFEFNKQIAGTISISPEEMAIAFADGDSDQQAAFLNAIAAESASWGGACDVFQISYIRGLLTPEALNLIRIVAEYAQEGS